jgi:hypothetical protein
MSELPFITKYDALGESSASIDPLGALQVYGALVDLLLPGLSTITTRARYLSLVCAALQLAENARTYPIGPSGVTQRREAAEPYERLWALGSVLANDSGAKGATEGLRGVTRATRALRDFQARGAALSPRYRLLKYQSRTGGIPTYWVTLISAGLIDDAGKLLPDGRALAARFPQIPLSDRAKRDLCMPSRADGVSADIESFREWSAECHLGNMKPDERRILGEALRSEGRRSCVAAALLAMQRADEPIDSWAIAPLKRLRRHLERDDDAVRLLLPATIDSIIVAERFHEAAAAVFERVLFWGTVSSHQSVWLLVEEPDFREAADLARARANELVIYFNACQEGVLRATLREFVGFADALIECGSARDVLNQVMHRHCRVQAGKIAGGAPKREWVAWASTERVFRPSPRYQRTEPPKLPTGRYLTHPYRLEPFIGMLREASLLKPAAV